MSDPFSPTLCPQISPDQLPSVALAMARSGLALMLYGSPGIGKTSLFQELGRHEAIRDWAAALSGFPKTELPVATLSAPELNVEDLLGVPTLDDLIRYRADGSALMQKVTHWAIPAIFDPVRPFILFVDEPNRCDPTVRNALFQLVTGKTTTSGFILPKGSIVCMAGNRLEDRAGVRALDTAFNNRCGHFELVPDHEAWLGWAGAIPGFSGLVRAFIAAHPCYLNHFDPQGNTPQQPTPRTWGALGQALGDGSEAALQLLAHGLVGMEAARIFSAFCTHAELLPTLARIVADPETLPLPETQNLDGAWILATNLVDHLCVEAEGPHEETAKALAIVLGRLARAGFEEVVVFSLRRAWRFAERRKVNGGLPLRWRFFQVIPQLASMKSFRELMQAMEEVG